MPITEADLRCIGCERKPSEISEYSAASTGERDITPEHYVWLEEGTLNRENGHFRCTECYIKAGMPLGVTP